MPFCDVFDWVNPTLLFTPSFMTQTRCLSDQCTWPGGHSLLFFNLEEAPIPRVAVLMVKGPIDNRRSVYKNLGRCQENGFETQRGAMDKCVQMNPGALRFQTARECICVFHTNRTREAEGRLLWSANEKG
ncbi:hypothetical protein TNCV_219851 [Trichonephila clavipes]|nr:hypothetical protein TNCV_219851 [Trichonephila clavipes]